MVLHVLNLHDGASLDYSLAFIKALIIPPCSCASVSAANLSSGASQLWPANGSVLKCFVPLKAGGNRVRLSCRHNASDLTVHFAPSPRQHRVRLLYITARGSDGSFQAPRGTPCGPEAAARRIRTGAQLLQALTAELLAEAGLPRRTFQLMTEEDGVRPAVDRFECSLTEDKARALPGRELWPTLARELAAEFGEEMDHVKWLGFMAFTRYSCDHSPLPRSHEEVMERTRGHCALGKEKFSVFLFSLFSSLSLYRRVVTLRANFRPAPEQNVALLAMTLPGRISGLWDELSKSSETQASSIICALCFRFRNF